MALTSLKLVDRLSRFQKPTQQFDHTLPRAAVAIMICDTEAGPEMLMILRAKRQGDPWSGHMGFPGGRRDQADKSDLCCAARETSEELGFVPESCGRLLCELSCLNTGWRPGRPEMLVTPFVFFTDFMPDLRPNDEVEEVVWVPITFLLNDKNRQTYAWRWEGRTIESDSVIFFSHRIWGLSLMMIDEILKVIRD